MKEYNNGSKNRKIIVEKEVIEFIIVIIALIALSVLFVYAIHSLPYRVQSLIIYILLAIFANLYAYSCVKSGYEQSSKVSIRVFIKEVYHPILKALENTFSGVEYLVKLLIVFAITITILNEISKIVQLQENIYKPILGCEILIATLVMNMKLYDQIPYIFNLRHKEKVLKYLNKKPYVQILNNVISIHTFINNNTNYVSYSTNIFGNKSMVPRERYNLFSSNYIYHYISSISVWFNT